LLLQQYIQYFETLAAQHSAIGHTPASISGDVAPLACKFATYNANDVLMKNMRTRVGFPALLAEVYEWDIEGSNLYDQRSRYRGAFSIVTRSPANNAPAEIEALQLTETILQQVVHRIFKDHYGDGVSHCATPFQHIDVQRAEAMAFGPIWDNVFGWRWEFSFRPKAGQNLYDPLPENIWLDLQEDEGP
jgi:hypothetical protein